MKLYVAVLDEAPDYMVPTLVAHAVLGAHLKFSSWEYHPAYMVWLEDSFKKVTVRVNRKEFTKISELNDVHLAFEKTILDGAYSCAVVCPRDDIPNVLKFAKLWKPKNES